jgi:hypothetical protein
MLNHFSKNKGFLIFLLSCIFLFLSFYFNEDGSGGGARGDFESTFGFILALQENLLINPQKWALVHLPLHFIILSLVTRVVSNIDLLRLMFCFFSLSLPLIFFSSILIKRSYNISKTNIFILASALIFIPSFRYTSIWANDLITSLTFFTISIYFFNKWECNEKRNFDKNCFLNIFFLILATYTRQYFAVFFFYFLYKYFLFFSIKNFVKIFLICVISSIPAFYYTYLFPELLTEQHISYKAINYFLLGNTSILAVTLFPIIFINLIYNKINLKKLVIPSLISLILVFILSLNFTPVEWQGGGVNYLISHKIFNNNIYFYFTSLFTLTFFIYLSLEEKENILILIIVVFMFFSMQVYQRYYEPMFFIIFFTIIKTNLVDIFYKQFKCCVILLSYFVIYYLISVSDLIYKI